MNVCLFVEVFKHGHGITKREREDFVNKLFIFMVLSHQKSIFTLFKALDTMIKIHM